MASGGAEEDSFLDIDNIHMLLQVEQEQIQKRTFTNWMNAQLSKRCPPSSVADLFSDLRDGTRLLDLLEVMSGQRMKRERGRGIFQQRGNIETALNFLKRKSVKLVNINVPDIIDGRPSIILGLIWTIILHCHIEELASTLSFSSRHSSLDSLASLDSCSSSPALGSPAPASPVPRGRTSPLHNRFRLSAKKALLMWVKDQCQRAGCSVSVRDFKSSWRSGVGFLAILCSLRPDLVDLSLVQSRSNQQNLEEAFHLAARELHIPRLLEPQDIDVDDPDEKSIMTYVAQFLQYSNDMPAPDDHLQASPNQRAREVTGWLEQAYQELSETWAATERASYPEQYQAFQSLARSFSEQRRPVMPLLGAMRRCPEPSQEQRALRLAWDRLEEKLQQCQAELELTLPTPLGSVVAWLQCAEAELTEEGGRAKDHAHAAKQARTQQDKLKTLNKELSHHFNTVNLFRNTDESGAAVVPLEKLEEIKRRLTNIRVTAKYHGIKLEYQEHRHTVLDLLGRISAKLRSWECPYSSQETVRLLLQDWHETVERQGLMLSLTDELEKLKQMADTYMSKAALGEDSQLVGQQVKEAEREAALSTEAVMTVKGTIERVLSAWEAYDQGLPSLQAWLAQNTPPQTHTQTQTQTQLQTQTQTQLQTPAVWVQERPQVVTEWRSRQAQLNELGNLLIEVTEPSTSLVLAEQLSEVNMLWADYMKRTMFEAPSQPSVGPLGPCMVQAWVQDAAWLLKQPVEVASVPLKAYRQRIQLLSKKIMDVALMSLSPSPDYQASDIEKLQQTLPEVWQLLSKAERTCDKLQHPASLLEGRLAELVHWSTETLESYQHLTHRQPRGHSGLEPRAKVLMSQGLQLQGQVVTEGHDLQALVEQVQRSSPLQHLSASTMQDRISEAVSQSQEVVEMLSSLGTRQGVGETPDDQPPSKMICPIQQVPKAGLLVVTAAKDVDRKHENVGNLELQTQDPTQLPLQAPSQTPPQRKGLQGLSKSNGHSQDITIQKATIKVVPHAVTHVQPQPLVKTRTSQVQPSLVPTPEEDQSELMIQPRSPAKSQTQAPNPCQHDLPPLTPAPVRLTSQQPAKALSTILSKAETHTVGEKMEGSSPTQTHTPSLRVKAQPNTPQLPVMVRSEVHSKAQSMARSRLEKARFRLQDHVREAIILFGDKEISEWQAKRKQRALKILRPAILEGFLGAVDGFMAFCSGPQLQDLMFLSDSVRKQWEDVRSDMAAFVPMLWTQIRAGKQPCSAVECEVHANSLHDATDPNYVQTQQACLSTGSGASQRMESLQELCDNLAPGDSSCLATAQLRESGGRQETVHQTLLPNEPSGTAPPQDSRGEQLRGHTLLRATSMQAGPQPVKNLPQKATPDCPQQDLLPSGNARPLPVLEHPTHVNILPLQRQDNPPSSEDRLPKTQGHLVFQDQEPLLHAKDHPLRVCLLHIPQRQHSQAHLQAVVKGDIVETQQAAERTVIPQVVTPPQEESSSEQEVLERYTSSCLAFQSRLQWNSQRLEAEFLLDPVTISTLQSQRLEAEFLLDPVTISTLQSQRLEAEFLLDPVTISTLQSQRLEAEFLLDPVTISTLQSQLKDLQALKQETEALWFEFELQYAQLSQFPQLMKVEGQAGGQRDRVQLVELWRRQQTCLQTRMASLDAAIELMEATDHQMKLITEQLDQITREPVDISSFTVADQRAVSVLKDVDDRLQSELRKLSGRHTEEEERLDPAAPPSCRHALRYSGHGLSEARRRLEEVQSAAQALESFLAKMREANLVELQGPSRRGDESVWNQERESCRASEQQSAGEEAGDVDHLLQAAGMTLTMDGAIVTCRDVVASLARHDKEVDQELTGSNRGMNKERDLQGRKQIPEEEGGLNPKEMWFKTEGEPLCSEQDEAQDHRIARGIEEDSGLEPKKSRWNEQNEDSKTQREEEMEDKPQRRAWGEGLERKRGQDKTEGEEKRSTIQRRFALLGVLREIRGGADQLGLKELTLPAVQQRMRALTELESRLAGQRSELQYLRDASSQAGDSGGRNTVEVEALWEETQRLLTERLDQGCVLSELLKRFQSIRGELGCTLQRAERTIDEQASYMGKDNLQRLLTKVQDMKAELNVLGEVIEEVRGVCRQLHTHLRQIPDCTVNPFEDEADSLMDRWLDVTERTDSHLDNLHLGLALWEGVLQLGGEVESWTNNKLVAFAQSPPFQTEEEVTALQEEILAQEECMEHFHRRAAEIQVLLQSTEPPLELQVVETQMRKKMEQVKELFSEAEDVYRQMMVAKGQVTARMAQCHQSVQKVQDSLATLSASDAQTILDKIQDMCTELQAQEEQAEGVLEDLRLMAYIASPQSLQSLAGDSTQLQEKLSATRQLLSQVDEQTERDIQALNRLQRESERLERWLQAIEEKVKEEELSDLPVEAFQQRERQLTETVRQLVLSLQSSSLKESGLVKQGLKLLQRHHNLQTTVHHVSEEKQSSLTRDTDVFQALARDTQSWVRELRQQADSPVADGLHTQSPVERRLCIAQAVVSMIAEAESRLEELSVAGCDLGHRLGAGDDLKQTIQQTIQETEGQWRGLLQSLYPQCSVLQAEPELSSSYLSRRQEARSRVEDLHHRTAQLPKLFTWPGSPERRQARRQARDLLDETESLGPALTSLAEQRRELAQRTNHPIWEDSSWDRLDSCQASLVAELNGVCSSLEEGQREEERCGQLLQDCYGVLTSLQERMSAFEAQQEGSAELNTDVEALEALLQEARDADVNLLELGALEASLSAEAQASLSHQVSSLQNHKGALESCIREKLAEIEENRIQRVQQVREEASFLHTALKDLAERLENLSRNDEALTDISHLKQHWCTIQDCDTSLTELAARVNFLQNTGESKVTEEKLPADVRLAVHAFSKGLDSLKSICLQNQQESADHTVNRVSQTISQLEEWNQTVQSVLSQPSQITQLQQTVQRTLSEQDFFLLCLGENYLDTCTSDALHQSTAVSKYLMDQGHTEVELDNKESWVKTDEESFRGETLHSAAAEETRNMCRLGSLDCCFYWEHSGTDQNENKMQDNSPRCTQLNTESVKEVSGRSTVEADVTKQDHKCISQNIKEAETSLLCTAGSPVQPPKGDTFAQTQLPSRDNPGISKLQHEPKELTQNLPKIATIILETDLTQHLHGTSEEDVLQVKSNKDSSTTNMDSSLSPLSGELFPVSLRERQVECNTTRGKTEYVMPESVLVFNRGFVAQQEEAEPRHRVSSIILDPKLPAVGPKNNFQETEYSHCSTSLVEYPDKPVWKEKSVPENRESRNPEFTDNKEFKIHKSCVVESELIGTDVSETVHLETSQGIAEEELTDLRHTDNRAEASVTCTVDGPMPPLKGDALTQTQPPGPDSTDTLHTDTTGNVNTGMIDETFTGNTPDTKGSVVFQTAGGDPRLSASLGAKSTEGIQGPIQEGMEADRRTEGLPSTLGAEERTGGSLESPRHLSTMQAILSQTQSSVESSDIINRAQHLDLTWYLESSPGEAEIRLVRTVLRVVRCRYQPAQLSVTAMTKQLEEAEEYRCSVLEQVAAMSQVSAARVCGPEALRTMETCWSAALLDASATVQVKAAQLDQVTQYHRQMKDIRVLLEEVAAEMEKLSLDDLRSSNLQAEKLHALLLTMEQKKGLMGELLRLSGQLAAHLSEAESSGALLAQLGDVQEEQRLLEGSIKRALRHTSTSSSQYAHFLKEAEQLQANIEALQKSITSLQSSQTIHDSTLEFACMTADLKTYNQLYLHLQSQSEALGHFSLGQKEKEELALVLQELRALLNVTRSQLDTYSPSVSSTSLAKINKHLKDLFTWAKQAENHVTVGKKLALFPEEARIQISEMRKFQSDILSRQYKMPAEVEEIKAMTSDMDKEETDQVLASLKTMEDLYKATADSSAHALDIMVTNLQEREKLLRQLAGMDAWLAEAHAKRDPCAHVENVSTADILELENTFRIHKLATEEIENQIAVVDILAENSKETAAGLSPAESHYLVNRISGLWTELDGMLAHERATSWELQEVIHERISSDEELATIRTSLEQISTDLEQQTFPSTKDNLSAIALMKHMLMEHQCQIQELQHCQEAKRSSLLCTVGELQDRSKTLSIHALDQDKYLHLKKQMEESRDIAERQIKHSKDQTVSVSERFRLCQTLLVELPLVKTQCQEAADQLEAIAQDLYPSQLHSERQGIRHTVEKLVSWEHRCTDDIKSLESQLLEGLHFHSELPALMDLFQRTRQELEGAEPVDPNEKDLDITLQRCWVMWRNMESWMRVLEALGRKEKLNLRIHGELYSLRDAAMQECHSHMESLSQAREALKDYLWAAQGAMAFLHNAEATFLSAPGGFLDCTEEQRQTQQALASLEDGLQAHISHLVELVPQQPCLSRPKTEQLHIGILSQLLVGRATLEAQAQLRMEALQRCAKREYKHRKYHMEIRQLLSRLEARLSDCAAEHVNSHSKCVDQQNRAKSLMKDLRSLAGKLEELRAGCPMQGCGVGKDGELSALWRRWVSLRRRVGLLLAHSEQRQEEWKDITTSMKQCCSSLASLQADVLESSTMRTQREPHEFLAQAEMHQVGLEQEQQSLASLEHRLEHALSLSSPLDAGSPGPVGHRLMKVQESFRSLTERNQLVVEAALAEDQERQRIQGEIAEVEQCVLAMLPTLESCSSPRQQQEVSRDLLSQKATLQSIKDGVQSRYAEVPADLDKQIQEVQLSLQRAQEKVLERSSPLGKLSSRVVEVRSGLEGMKTLLEQRSPTFTEAQETLKRVWDELDTWHDRLTVLESEAQDLAEEQPDQAHVLMDQLTQPLLLYQDTAHVVEQRTAFLSKIPACVQEFEEVLYSATCWIQEAQSWLSAPYTYTIARNLQSHANSLQLVLDDSERIRATLGGFGPLLGEISGVCDTSTLEKRLAQTERKVQTMQHNIIGPLEQLCHAAADVDAMESELRTIEKNITKIRTILSSMDNSSIPLAEHLRNRQVILANLQSMRKTLDEMESCKGELGLPRGAEESLAVFSRARLLLQPLQELEQCTQQQATLLESKVREEEEAEEAEEVMLREDVFITAAESSDRPGDTQEPDGTPPGSSLQEACGVCSSEEDEDEEEEESPRSSSTDTLTCSVPEDPEEILMEEELVETKAPTVQCPEQHEDKPESQHLLETKESSSSPFWSEAETSLITVETGPVTPGLVTTETGSAAMEPGLGSETEVGDASSHVTMVTPPPAAEDLCTPVSVPTLLPGTHTTNAYSQCASVATKDTRLIPTRPITPFPPTGPSVGVSTGRDKTLSLSTPLHQDMLQKTQYESEDQREHVEVKDTPGSVAEESQQAGDTSKTHSRLAGLEEEEQEEQEEVQRWSALCSQISQKHTTLRKVQEEHLTVVSSGKGQMEEKEPDGKVETTGSGAAVLREAHESTSMLRRLRHTIRAEVRSADGSPGVEKELYTAIRRGLLCLDALTDLLLTPVGAATDDHQLRLLQHQCVSAELVILDEALSRVGSEVRPSLLTEELTALQCLTGLQGCVHTAQLVLTSSQNQLLARLGLSHKDQAGLEPVKSLQCVLEDFDPGQSDSFPNIENVPILEYVLGRRVKEPPEEEAKLQLVSRASLQGTARLLKLGEEGIIARQTSQLHNRSQLQPFLCRQKTFFQVLGSHLAFVQYVFQREPEALKSPGNDPVQLELRAKALQQQALEQEVDSQTRLQAWSRWEGDCGRLGRMLDELEALSSAGEPEGEIEEEICPEEQTQNRLDAGQQVLVQLDRSRAALGRLLDQGEALQTDTGCITSASQAGAALQLRWQNMHRRTAEDIQRSRDIQDSEASFKRDSSSLSEWLASTHKYLETLSGLADTNPTNQQLLPSCLTQLLDFSMEVEARAVQKASVAREGSLLLRMREVDCPWVHSQLAQLEVSWSQLTSDLSTAQNRLQQLCLAGWPRVEVLCDLEVWVKKVEARLGQERERVLEAQDAASLGRALRVYQELKAGVISGQLLLDFLCQSGPQVVGADSRALHAQRTLFAEQLGALNLHWLHLQGELESQMREAEEMRHTCADRERRLQRLHTRLMQQTENLKKWQRPVSQTLCHEALLEWEAVDQRAKEEALALRELRAVRVTKDEQEDEHPSDTAFAGQTDSVSQACVALGQQMEALKPALQKILEEWSRFDRELNEVSLQATRVRCALQHYRAPLLSPKQARSYTEQLQQLQETAGKGEELWAAVDKSYQTLKTTVDHMTAELLNERMEGEQRRWKEGVQEIEEELCRTEEVLSLWQEYIQLSDLCSLRLQQVQRQWEELCNSPSTLQQDTQARVCSVEKLQDMIEDLENIVGDVLAASKPLTERLEPLAARLIQSDTTILSHDILLLGQALARKQEHLQEDLEQHKMFCSNLDAVEKQTQTIMNELTSVKDVDSVTTILSELTDLLPSLLDLREMSCYVSSDHEEDRRQELNRQWTEGLTQASDMKREMQAEIQGSQNFQQKCESLQAIQKKLEEDLVVSRADSYSGLLEMLPVYQRLQTEVLTGYQLLQGLLCDAVESLDNLTGEKRSELMVNVTCVNESWASSVALASQRRTLVKEQLCQWRTYNHGLKLLWRFLRDVDAMLPPAGPAQCTLQHLQSSADNHQRVEEMLGLHAVTYSQTLEAGRQLCVSMTEHQALQEAWEPTVALLERRRTLVNTVLQDWSRCQDGLADSMFHLDELKTGLEQQLLLDHSDHQERLIQEKEVSLERLAGGLGELAAVRTSLSQYVAAGDTAVLEQQLQQLHCQWEELCVKVSSRRQEISDRLNAWTIFNDKKKELCDWLSQMENKVCHSGDLSMEEMVEKLKKDCMEEINLFSENKSHLKQLGEQLLQASDEAKKSQLHGTLQEVNQRWHNLFHHIEARVKKLKETLVTVQQLDKNMSNLRSWLSRVEAELSRPITYSVCHHQEIQRRLAEHQELQRDIEQHTEGVTSVLTLCDVLLRDEDAACGTEVESDSLQETSRSLDQRWRTICTMALDRRLRIEETWRLWCKFLDDYSRFEDWLKMAERTAANPNSADVLYTVAKEELKKFESFQRQIHERLTQLEMVNNQYRRLARENRTDRASQLKAMVHQGNRRWDSLHRRVATILRRLKYFTGQREDFEGTRESMLVWLTELDLQLTNVEHFSESDVQHKMQQLNGFQKEITLNTERIDGLIVFGEGLIQKSSPLDAVLIEEELEELHSYCQEVFSRLVRFHQRLSQPPAVREEPELFGSSLYLEGSLELIGRPWLGRSQGSLPATPTHLLASPLERSGRETPMSVESLPLEWDHTGDLGGSSSHEDDEEEHEEEGAYFSALSEEELSQEEFVEATEALGASSLLVPNRSTAIPESPGWRSPGDPETEPLQLDTEGHTEPPPTHTSTPLKQGYLRLMSECSGSIENIKRVSLILDDEEQPEELGLTGLTSTDKQSGVIERWELLQAQSRSEQQAGPWEPQQLTSDLGDITSWLGRVIPELEELQHSDPAASIKDMEARVKQLKEMQKMFAHYKSVMLSVNLGARELQGCGRAEALELQENLGNMNQGWSQACTGLQQWDNSLRKTLVRCQEFHQTLHSLLLWLAHAESRRYAVDLNHPDTPVNTLLQHHNTLTGLQEELQSRQTQLASLQSLWAQLQPEEGTEEDGEAREKLHVTGNKLKLLLRQVAQDLSALQGRLDCESVSSAVDSQGKRSQKDSKTEERREPSPPRSFFSRVLRAAFPLHLLLLLLLVLTCLVPLPESDPSCTLANNFARSFYPMLHYTNGPPPT